MKGKQLFKIVLFLVTVLAVLSFIGCQREQAQSTGYARNETLYVGGGMWDAPINWNPMQPWSCTTGTVGLIYETLFIWDPLTDEMTPWLAESGDWESDSVYKVVVRKGVKWSDGKDLTAKDVKFTFDMGKKYEQLPTYQIWELLESVELVDDYTVKFMFKDARYHEWAMSLYQNVILPEHIWSKKQKDEIIEGANEPPVGTGPYLHETYDQDKMVYLKNESWWAIEQKSMNPAPKRIIVLKIYSNSVALGMVLRGDMDMSNFYLPGIPQLKKQYDGIHTWFDAPPYNISDATNYLFINNRKAPFDDPAFRKAVAYAIDVDEIVKTVYENQVIASNSIGYLDINGWMQYADKEVMKAKGFEYNPEKAKKMFTDAGYIDRDGNGTIDLKDGTPFNFSVICPQGWTDWEESVKVIAKNLQAIGFDCDPKFPDYGKYWQDMTGEAAEYDMAINNFESVANISTFRMYNWLSHEQGLTGDAEIGNYARYDNEEFRNLLDEFNRTKLSNPQAAKPIASRMQEILLEDMPAVPLWYNGLWFQASSAHWTNWPGEENPYARPCTYGGNWQLGTIKVLCELKPVSQ